jgi:hypothetical protein
MSAMDVTVDDVSENDSDGNDSDSDNDSKPDTRIQTILEQSKEVNSEDEAPAYETVLVNDDRTNDQHDESEEEDEPAYGTVLLRDNEVEDRMSSPKNTVPPPSLFGDDEDSDIDGESTYATTSSVQDHVDVPTPQQTMPPPPPRASNRDSSSSCKKSIPRETPTVQPQTDGCRTEIKRKLRELGSCFVGGDDEPMTKGDVVRMLTSMLNAGKQVDAPTTDTTHTTPDHGTSPIAPIMDLLIETNGKVFMSAEMAKLMSTTPTFACIAKARCVGSTSSKTTYFLTPGGFRKVSDYGDAFKPILRQIITETRELLLGAVTDETPEAVRLAIRSWAQASISNAEAIFTEAVQTYVTAWDDFDLNGRLMGGDDAIIDTSSGSVEVRSCTHADHVSYNVGYDIKNVLENQKTAEYLAFKQKLERIIKVPGHRSYLMPLLAAVALNGHKAWLMKLIMAVCGPKDSAKSTLFLYLIAALGNDYSGNIDFNELTTGQATGSCNDAAMRMYLDRKRFCLIDEGEEDDSDVSGRSRKRLMHSRIKSLMSNTPKKARGAHSLQYNNVGNFPFIVITLNQSNMFAKPSNNDDLDRWLLLNADSLAKFKTGVDDDDVAHVYTKDPGFVHPETVKANRIHMLSLLCEYYNASFDEEASIPTDLLRVRNEWDYRYEGGGSSSNDVAATTPPAPLYIVPSGKNRTQSEVLDDLIEKTCELLVKAPGKLVTLKVRTKFEHPWSMTHEALLGSLYLTTERLFSAHNLQHRILSTHSLQHRTTLVSEP